MAKKKNKNIDQFKQGIFSLRTNFGELAQLMIKKDMGLHTADDGSYDLKDDDGHKVEVKFSRAYKKVSLTEDNAIDMCTNSSSTVYASSEAEDKAANYDCNIEQLKPRCFDSLYMVFFSPIKLKYSMRLVLSFLIVWKASSKIKLPHEKSCQDTQFSIKAERNVSSI